MSSAPGSSMSPKIDFDTRDKHLNVALHTYGRTIGPMPVQNFLDIFLPDTRPTAARRRNHFLHRIPTRKRYKPFIKALNGSKICPGFDFVSLDVNVELLSTSVPQLGPNIAVYPRGGGPKSHCDWSLMDFFIEWRPDEDLDGYRTSFGNKQILDDDSEAALEIRGRIFTYAAQLMDSQHRLFVFAVDIYGPRARLYRFDPSCIIVSDIIYFRKDPSLLEDFFLRYSACSSVQRGHDPTVTPANDAEKALFQASVKDYFNRARRNNLRTHPDVARLDNKIMKIQVNDVNGGVYWYLACKCSTVPVNSSPCGRFTRGFIAIPAPSDGHNPEDAEKGRLFWLKDSWRSNSSQSEASMYYELKTRGVPNLPDIKCAGDILVGSCTQETTNDILLSDSNTKSWRRPTDVISHMVHIRLVSGILIPLEHIRTQKIFYSSDATS
ncbi:hypothetical protein QCA50_008773 [Cerrena zonata]|uniref:Fungal-type protein kinase domain-containing protein n=1 Tax=Cerrena zonata TaxID=2478898 RepID=A0AAW0GB66_9APHY